MSWFARLFREQESFPRDPYGYITNQLSHAFLGITLVSLYTYLWFVLVGEYPNQVMCVAVITFFYTIWWEALYQKWRGLQSLEDSFYVFLGASPFLNIDMSYVLDKVLVWLLTITFFLCIGVVVRLKEVSNEQ